MPHCGIRTEIKLHANKRLCAVRSLRNRSLGFEPLQNRSLGLEAANADRCQEGIGKRKATDQKQSAEGGISEVRHHDRSWAQLITRSNLV